MNLSWNGQVSLASLVPPPPNASPKAHQRHYYFVAIGLWATIACLSSYHTIFKKYLHSRNVMHFGLTQDGCHHGAYDILEENMENDISLFSIYE